MRTKQKLLLLIDRLATLILWVLGLLAIYIVANITSLASFKIPTDSMTPAILPGDNVLVNKWVMGARIFNPFKAATHEKVVVRRLPALGRVERNDVLVFNFPYPLQWDSIGLDMSKYYVKRCLGLPGDTLEIRHGYYRINDDSLKAVNPLQIESLRYQLQGITSDSVARTRGICLRSYPRTDSICWTILDFGPLFIPNKGSRIMMNDYHYLLYRNLIEWEQRKKLLKDGSVISIADSVISTYTFEQNYYFVAGDKVIDSQDSRYWGLLPEQMIVGKATCIWKSVNPYTDEVRWNRLFRKIE